MNAQYITIWDLDSTIICDGRERRNVSACNQSVSGHSGNPGSPNPDICPVQWVHQSRIACDGGFRLAFEFEGWYHVTV